ncbi:MAG: hypothetical protein ACLQUY_03885 [Ktedonobacterales bacterium]
MQRFRAFSSAGWDDDVGRMEQAINAWLDSEHPHIHMMAQASLSEHLIVSFVYADSFQMETTAAAASVAEMFEREAQDAGWEEEDEEAELSVTLPVMELPY